MRKGLVFLLIAILSLTSGCQNVRKKFIRKKKYKKEVPVYVNFKDYSGKPSRNAYVNYYLFVRGWLEDLTEALKKGISNKRQRRAVNQAIMNLEEIITFYNPEGKEKIYPLYEELQGLRETMEKEPNMSETKRNALVRKIERLKRRLEKDFNYNDAEKWMN
ncbi:MAG: hypothetical protein ABIE75_00865 [Candidatus Omnitrophota bacterium]